MSELVSLWKFAIIGLVACRNVARILVFLGARSSILVDGLPERQREHVAQ